MDNGQLASQPAEPELGIFRHRRLIGLNFALLMVLAVVTIVTSSQVVAQPAGATSTGRSRGEYTIISGKYQGGISNAVYVLDAANQELLALAWNRNRDEFEIIGHRRLTDDARFNQGR